jgi:hypothetical protein
LDGYLVDALENTGGGHAENPEQGHTIRPHLSARNAYGSNASGVEPTITQDSQKWVSDSASMLPVAPTEKPHYQHYFSGKLPRKEMNSTTCICYIT